MPPFNPNQPKADVPQYVSSSRGVEYRGDTSRGILLEGLSKTFEGLVKGADTIIKDKIQTDVEQSWDTVNNEFGVSAVAVQEASIDGQTPPGPNPPGPGVTPAAIQTAGQHIQDLSAAYNRGALTDRNYYGRLESMVRQLRGKYPGYRTEIDDIVRSVTGSRPANEIRQEILKEFKLANGAASKQQDKYDSLVTAMAHDQTSGGLPPDFYTRKNTNNPYQFDELQAWRSQRYSEHYTRKREENEMEWKNKQNTLQKNNVLVNHSNNLNDTVRQITQDSTKAVGQQWARMNDLMRQLSENPELAVGLTAEQRNGLQVNLATMKNSIQQALVERQNTPFGEASDPKNFYRYWITDKEREDARNEAMAPVLLLERGLNGENGILKSTVNYINANKDRSAAEIMRRFPWIANIAGMEKHLGQVGTNHILQVMPTQRVGPLAEFLANTDIIGVVGNTFQNPKTPPSFTQDATKPEVQAQGKQYFDQHLAALPKLLADPKVDPKAKSAWVQYYFGPANGQLWDTMDAKVRRQFFTDFAQPRVTTEMINLGKTDPQAFQTYQGWALQTGQVSLMASFNQLKGYNLDRRTTMISYNPQTNAFSFVNNPNADPDRNQPLLTLVSPMTPVVGPLRQLEIAGRLIWDAQTKYQAQETLTEINEYLNTLKPLVVHNGQKMPEQIQMLIQSISGLNTPAGNTAADLLIEGINKANPPRAPQGAGQTQRPFEEAPNLWEQLTPYNPQWVPPSNPQFDRLPQERTELSPPVGPLGTVGQGATATATATATAPATARTAAIAPSPLDITDADIKPDALNLSDDEKLPVPQQLLAFTTPNGKTIGQIVQDATKAGTVSVSALAESFIGSNESNAQANKTLTAFFKNFGGQKLDPAQTAWCAAFANSILAASGDAGTGRLNAKSFLAWGYEPEKPRKGDVIVLTRGSTDPADWRGHVGFFDGYNADGSVRVLGGNQDNSVNIKSFPRQQILGIRRSVRLSEMKTKDKTQLAALTMEGTA